MTEKVKSVLGRVENIVGKGEMVTSIFACPTLFSKGLFFKVVQGVLHSSVVKCLTRNPEVLGSSRTGSSVFFVGMSLGKTLQSPSLVLVKPRKDIKSVSCRHDMTEILLKAA